MTRAQKIWTAIAGAHIVLVAYNALLLPLPGWGNPLGDGLRWYGAMSGANNSYGFFKQVGCCFRVRFTLDDAAGTTWEDELNRGLGQEEHLRFNSGVNLISEYGEVLAKNWAASMFGRHPSAKQLLVEVERFDPGTMEDYQAGKRPQWERAAVWVFDRNLAVVPQEQKP